MENNRFLLDSDYLEIITKEALEQIIQPGNEYKFIQAGRDVDIREPGGELWDWEWVNER